MKNAKFKQMVEKSLKRIFKSRLEEISWGSYWEFTVKRSRWTPCYNDIFIIHFFNIGLYFNCKKNLHNLSDGTFLDKKGREASSYMYGFYFDRNKNLDFLSFVYGWGADTVHLEFPWFTWKFKKMELLDFDGNVLYTEQKSNQYKNWKTKFKLEDAIANAFSEEFDYTYVLKDGTEQKRKAKINVTRRTWTRKWFPWIKNIKTSINVKFSDEIGEKTGSWKGGCVGCGYDMLEGETPEQCLRRMEKERIFK